MKKMLTIALLGVTLGGILVWLLSQERPAAAVPGDEAVRVSEQPAVAYVAAGGPAGRPVRQSSEHSAEEAEEDGEETATDDVADPEEEKVDAFDSLTDRWTEPRKTGVTMKDVDAFVAAFRQVPKARQEECVQRALNLVPDENVMLLVGVLMDRSADKDIVETVFNDILNRGEDVKKPILLQVYRDKDHPCQSDAAWILDVADETADR